MASRTAARTIALSAVLSDLGGTKVLEWKPRFVAVLVVLVLVLTVATGYAEWFFDNWEW
jgi:hypothetical protein